MKFWGITKNIFFSLASVLLIIYAAIYLIAPYLLNKQDFSKLVTNKIKQETGLVLLIDNYKLKVSPKLDIAIKAQNISMFYPNKHQILAIQSPEIELSTIYLLKKEIKIKNIKAKELQFSTKLKKNGKTTIQEYIEKNIKNENNNLKFNCQIPNIKLEKYIFKIKDEKSNKLIKINGEYLKIKQNYDYRYADIITKGSLLKANKKYIDFDTETTVSKKLITQKLLQPQITLDELLSQEFYAYVKSKLKITENDNKKATNITGTIDITNFKLKIGDKILPPSNLYITLDKNKAKLISKFHTNINETIDIKADIKTTEPYLIDMHCYCPNADIQNLQQITIPVLNILKIK
jgi:hypothetical protein